MITTSNNPIIDDHATAPRSSRGNGKAILCHLTFASQIEYA